MSVINDSVTLTVTIHDGANQRNTTTLAISAGSMKDVSIIIDQNTGEELFLEYWQGRLILRHHQDHEDENPQTLWVKEMPNG